MKYRLRKQRMEDGSFDLNIAPMLDMMVTLIPFLLLSSVFLRITLIDSPLPSAVAQTVVNEKDKKEKDVSIKLYLTAQGGRLEVTENGAKEVKNLPFTNNSFDFTSIHNALVQVKVRNPNIFRLEVHPSQEVAYKNVIEAMDVARKLKTTDPKVYLQDKNTKENVATDLLFPDVVLGNVVEG